MIRPSLIAVVIALAGPLPALAQDAPDFTTWPVLLQPFESTGGGGIMIDGYNPVIASGECRTDFSVAFPDGRKALNEATFDAVEAQGGVWCRNGRWRAKDGSTKGTTPFEMFVKAGIVYRLPPK
jgi:hypothetical protein